MLEFFLNYVKVFGAMFVFIGTFFGVIILADSLAQGHRSGGTGAIAGMLTVYTIATVLAFVLLGVYVWLLM